MTYLQFREKGTLAVIDVEPRGIRAFCAHHINGVATENALVWVAGIEKPFLLEDSADAVRAALKKVK